jgi:hypothetical protein
MVVRIAGRRMYLWRAVDQEGGSRTDFGTTMPLISAAFSIDEV